MFKVFYYSDKNGKSEIAEYIQELASKGGKDSRVKLSKIYEYTKYLSVAGPRAKEPYAKHLDGDIWELRPIRDRILYAAWDGKSFILLHHFQKSTQKTPVREIKKAKRNLADYRERSKDDEQ
jgi:phage-related protein